MRGEALKLGALVVVLLACGGKSSAERVENPSGLGAANGAEAFKVKCSKDRANCLIEAADACPGGYFVRSEESHSGGLLADTLPGPVSWWTMIVQCGQAPVGYVPPPQAAASVTPLQVSSPPAQQTTSGRTCYSNSDCWQGEVCANTDKRNLTVGQCVSGVR